MFVTNANLMLCYIRIHFKNKNENLFEMDSVKFYYA